MKTRVLIADDDYFFRQLLSSLFIQYGCAIKTVNRGEECLLSLYQEPVDLAVIDYHLPGMKGDMIISAARRQNITVPVIVVTADNSLEAERAVRKHGPAYFLVKPFNIKDLGKIYQKITTCTKTW